MNTFAYLVAASIIVAAIMALLYRGIDDE